MNKHNFGAGPAILPDTALQNTANAILDLDESGLSLLEISHRSKAFEEIANEAAALLHEILDIPSGYRTLFLGGGASTQFVVVPYNLLNAKAAFLETGAWAKKAVAEADHFGDVDIIASSRDKNFTYIPKGYRIPSDADYFHITTNNTIFGTQLHADLDSPIPLVADMSSDILSRPIDVSKYALIYGGCQKNMGPAGVSFVIVREDVLGKVERRIPTMLDYRTHVEHSSLYNTPPVASIFTVREVLRWVKAEGGVNEMQRRAEERAQLLYSEIDRNPLFSGTAQTEDRSLMNACFVMNEAYKAREEDFLKFVEKRGIVGLKGHRSVGGFRASMYNALPLTSVQELVDCMRLFEEEHA
ncbi:3-phosphoserine/phosphohydroxythreonine transaminase [Candidatus Saccharibacteria bacterium]|nr:MAG: 3-phosphoserine/phosphohydroxythreonine transaminase [Candidatus Saccharibacteria bacterium]PID99075.1 MAG: 3-phosphoserine/phosphohydroxythreonine transaminase [Candidatus Saccharibacteria bacterium]